MVADFLIQLLLRMHKGLKSNKGIVFLSWGPNDAVDHVFERFFRVDKARSRKSGGSGLGLAIVKNLVERNGGTIEVASELGQGSVFTVTFPIFDTEIEPETEE